MQELFSFFTLFSLIKCELETGYLKPDPLGIRIKTI